MRKIFAIGTLGILCASVPAWGVLTSFSASGVNSANSNDKAAVTFSISGGTLTVTLDNTSTTSGDIAPGDILHSVFFGTSAVTLTPLTAIATNGTVDPVGAAGVSVVNGWGVESFTPTANTLHYANYISSAGLSVNGSAGDKANFGNNSALDGTAYGIDPLNGTGASGGGCGSSCFLAVKEVVFTMTTTLTDLTALKAAGVAFNWGTDLGPVSAVPEPGFYGALALGLAGLLVAGSRAKRKVTV